MKNRKYFPFERNSYYFGKLLTARDFEAEQRYVNDKRRLQNRLLSGGGIVAGLGVVMVDDTSVVLQAGCAYDAAGREIVVPETKVVKLSTIEGFKALKGDTAYLAIAYEEYPADEVYAAMHAPEQENTFNKLQEGYRLELVDEAQVARIPGALDEFVTAQVLYADKDVEITQYVPKYLQRGTNLNLRVEIKQLAHGAGEYSFTYHIDAAGFTTAEGDGGRQVAVGGLTLGRNEAKSFDYPFTPMPHIWGGTEAVFTVSGFTLKKNGESLSMNQQQECTVKPIETTVACQFLNDWYAKPMDKQLGDSYDDKLWIARIDLFRQKSSVIIDKVYPPPFGQYCYNAQQLMQLRELADYYPGTSLLPSGLAAAPAENTAPAATAGQLGEFVRNTACGVFDLGLGLNYNTRDVVFSDEVMHGLGKGPVYVQLGVEYLTTGGKKGAVGSEIFLGDMALFEKEGRRGEERIYNVATAVKVLPERGTFVVAVQPKETSGLISLRIRWYAMRLNEISKQISSGGDGEKYILVNPDTIIVQPRGTAHISPVFINMPTEACNYKMVDPDGGTINNNGVYTAPAKEGVYEIRVEAVSDPTVFTHVFAIVTQKTKEQDEEAPRDGKKK